MANRERDRERAILLGDDCKWGHEMSYIVIVRWDTNYQFTHPTFSLYEWKENLEEPEDT